ncbi:hypothetical protein RND81_13G066200 [Saponaria officinalis]|uniref:Transmembrane protein n=1 Tax=Saponaria officinalis TaxID=3572 RepID=A0AAW1GUH4_SAPOF
MSRLRIDDCGFFQWVEGGASTCSRSSSLLTEENKFDQKMFNYNLILERKIEKTKGDKKRSKEKTIRLTKGKKRAIVVLYCSWFFFFLICILYCFRKCCCCNNLSI